MINIKQYVWRVCMDLAFSIFFPKPTNYKKNLVILLVVLFILLVLSVLAYKKIFGIFLITGKLIDAITALMSLQLKPQ